MAFIDTPRTDSGNATYMTNGNNIENLSLETSFLSPLKRQDDLILQLRSNGGINLKTPRHRAPLADRRNALAAPAQAEFTPLLKSVTKKNQLLRGKENGMPQNPASLRPGYRSKDSPALQAGESSRLYDDNTGSSVGTQEDGTPMPQMMSSSAQSTPLAVLPKRDGDGALAGQGNLLTLREQENIIDKVGKENFGLKLKIHFLEESLRKAGPRFHEAALKENTELKVGKITMQKELMGMKKALNQAARDVETYRVHLEDVQEKIKRKHADQGMKAELDGLRKELDVKTVEVSGLRKQLESAESEGHDVAKLKEDIEDLEATLREKDQILETSEDEVDKLKDQAAQNSADMAGLEEELEDARREVEKLQPLMDEFKKLQTSLHSAQVEVQKAKELQSTAEKEKQKAEEDLNELREELADKSFSTKGLSRQLEDKANKLQDDLDSIRRDYAKLQEILDGRTRELKRLTDESHYERQDAEIKQQKLRDDLELLRHEHSTVARKRDSLIDQVQQIKRDLQSKSEEKDLLQSRHDALTTESQALQKDLGRSQMKVQELELNLQEERQHFLRNERTLRDQAKEDFDRLSEEIDCLHRKLEDEANRHSAKEEHWTSQTQQFQMQKERNEQRTAGLQRLVDKLQRIEGTLSSKEMKLQEALESEEQRHQSEDAVLDCQIVELRKDIDDKRRDLEDLRSKHAEIKEELRISQRDCAASEENIVALEDENEVLRVHLDEACTGKIEAITARQELQSQIQSLKQELIRANTARDNAFAELETFIADHRASDGSKEQLDSRLRDMETQLQRVRREKQALQGKLTETDVELGSIRTLAAEAEAEKIETDSLRHDLSAARERETEYLRREAMQKEIIRDLKRQIADLERKIHEAELSRLAADSPKSSVEGSARKTEIVEVRRQLAEAHQQMKDIRSSAKELEREAKRKAAAVAKDTQQRLDECEQQKEQLEHQIADLRLRQEELTVNATTAEQTIKRLRNRIHNLEKDLHAARLNQVEDHTIAEERKDLHEMLKDAKLEAEDLQVQIAGNEKRLQSASIREADLRAQLKCVREERTLQAQKSSALTAELESLQQRYEQSVDEFARSQKDWEEERHAIVSRVRFPNMSVSSVHLGDSTELKQMETELQEKEKRHAAELRGLAKQIQWMRAKCMREERFRFGLAYEKKFLLLQIEMFSACNTVDLRLLEEMGVTPDRKVREKRPRLRAVGVMVLAGVRMQRLQKAWAGQKKIQASLAKKVESMRRQSRKSSVR